MIGDNGNILRRETPPITSRHIMTSSSHIPCIIFHDEHLLAQLSSHMHVSAFSALQRSQRWNIGIKKAKKTLQVTTQRGTWTIAYPSLDAHFCTNDRQLCYRRLKTSLYADTLHPPSPPEATLVLRSLPTTLNGRDLFHLHGKAMLTHVLTCSSLKRVSPTL
jgi:hypothetical protein